MILSGVVHLSYSIFGPTSDDLHRLFKNIKEGELSSSAWAYQTPIVVREGRILEPFLFFLHSLVLANKRAIRIIFEAGVMELLFHIDALGFAPMGSALRIVCDSLLDTCLETKEGWNSFIKDRLHVLWPLQMSFQDISDRQARRAEIWRSIKPEVVHMRMVSISRMMVQGQLKQNSLDDIAADILEFLG